MFTKFVWMLLLCCCFEAPMQSYGQNSPNFVDSLSKIANKKNPDSLSIKAITELQRFYFNAGRFADASNFNHFGIQLALKLNAKPALARLYYNAGLIRTNQTIYDSAVYFLRAAEEIAKEIADTQVLIHVYNADAMMSQYQSDFIHSITILTQTEQMIANSNNPLFRNLLPELYSNIAHNYLSEKQYDKVIAYQKKALEFSGYPNENRFKISSHLDMAEAYIKLGTLANASLHLDTARQLKSTLNNEIINVMFYDTEGAYYEAFGNKNNALLAYKNAYNASLAANNDYMKAVAANSIAKALTALDDLEEAAKFAQLANDLAIRNKQLGIRGDSYASLKNIEQKRGNYKAALQYAALEQLYKDSASSQTSQKMSLYLDARFQQQKKQSEITALTLTNTQQDLELVKRNRLMIIGGSVGLLLLFIFGMLIRSHRQKRVLAEKDVAIQQEQVKFLERQQQVVSLQSMLNGQETERTRIAKDLHDGLGGLFSTIKMYFSTLKHEMPAVEQHELFAKSYDMVNTASEEVRRIAHNMMPEVLIKLGLVQALQEMSNSINAGKLIHVSMQAYGMEQRLHSSTEIMLFRIVQELMNNIIKHAEATQAIIQFNRQQNRLTVTVEDNGRGFKVGEDESGTKAGLGTIQSRVHYLNGKISIDSGSDTGTTVMMDFLLKDV